MSKRHRWLTRRRRFYSFILYLYLQRYCTLNDNDCTELRYTLTSHAYYTLFNIRNFLKTYNGRYQISWHSVIVYPPYQQVYFEWTSDCRESFLHCMRSGARWSYNYSFGHFPFGTDCHQSDFTLAVCFLVPVKCSCSFQTTRHDYSVSR
jgi:hypothetical protein